MASTGKKGKKNKGKTVPLIDFLSSSNIPWSDQVDEADKLGEFIRKPALPAAPRAALALEIDESRISKLPPFVAYLSNLSYELEESDILNAFSDLNISNVRLPRDEHSGRMKGFGYVEFSDRGSFISALQKHEATIRGRRIKIDIAENEGERRRGGMRDNRDRKSNYDSERTLGDWRSGPRSEFSSNDDRRGPMSGKKDYGGFRDRDNYDKGRGDKESSWRDSERRFGSDRDRDSRSSYGSRRYGDSESNYSEPKTRAKLNLKPRTLPIEEIVIKEEPAEKKEERPETEKPSAASIFGQAKPVDTSAREREIEQRLQKERENKLERSRDLSKTRDSNENLSSEGKAYKPAPDPKENVWTRKSLKTEAQNISKEPEDGKDDPEEHPTSNENEKDLPDTSEEPSQYGDNMGNEDYDSDRQSDNRSSRNNKSDNRYSDRNREGDKGYRRHDRWRDDKARRDRRDYDSRDREYEPDRRRGNSGGRNREEREGDSRSYNERDGDQRKFGNERESDWRKNNEKEDRDNGRHRDQDDYGNNNKGPRGDRRSGPISGDKASRQPKGTQERERGPQNKEKQREQKKPEDGIRMPKLKEAAAPNYIGTNKYSFLEEDGVSE